MDINTMWKLDKIFVMLEDLTKKVDSLLKERDAEREKAESELSDNSDSAS